MTWSNKQKQLAARACSAAGIDKDNRELLLRQLDNRAFHNGKVTSTSPHLKQTDFDRFMAIVETASDGQIKIKRKDGSFVFPRGRFTSNDKSECRRLTHVAEDIAKRVFDENWQNQLDGWINSRVRGGKCRKLHQLTGDQLRDLLNGLRAFAKRSNINLPKPGTSNTQTQKRHGRSLYSTSSKQGREDAHKPITPDQIPF